VLRRPSLRARDRRIAQIEKYQPARPAQPFRRGREDAGSVTPSVEPFDQVQIPDTTSLAATSVRSTPKSIARPRAERRDRTPAELDVQRAR
jgi:hypothetical protein